uniref:Uncharacterized protein n=1 Tax=Avena sativa TaxID=4498 RepID=A0ACD5XWL7_AVESA
MVLLGNLAAAGSTATFLRQMRRAQRADGGPASILAIGTANPAHCVRQEEYSDYYFRVTNKEHLTELKAKLSRICHKSGIKKRYFHHTEELLQAHPEFLDHTFPSLDARLDITATAVPKLAAAAASRAIDEWGCPVTDITHLVVSTYSGAHMPGADHCLAHLLGLRSSVRTIMLYVNGCSSASTALRVAKDIAENNRGARVLVACAELTLIMFRGPEEGHVDTILTQALLGDGAGAVIVGADAKPGGSAERPLFDMVAATQSVIPETKSAAAGGFRSDGFHFYPSMEMPGLIRDNVEQCLVNALGPLGGLSGDWNELFWAVHPGGPAILDKVEEALQLEPDKLMPSRHVLSQYGNMSGPTLIFVLDEIRRRHDQHNGLGVMLGIGPGVAVETMLLHATPAA